MKYETLTKYIADFDNTGYGEWIVDEENDGSPEHPIQMPFVSYSETVHAFIKDVYDFTKLYDDVSFTNCSDILEKNNIGFASKSMETANAEELDDVCVMALIVGVMKMDRFCEGALFRYLNNGCILKWLKRLYNIDHSD